jgi:hypothetical protein
LKKKQKTSAKRGALAAVVPTPPVNQSFFASFCSQKEALASLNCS